MGDRYATDVQTESQFVPSFSWQEDEQTSGSEVTVRVSEAVKRRTDLFLAELSLRKILESWRRWAPISAEPDGSCSTAEDLYIDESETRADVEFLLEEAAREVDNLDDEDGSFRVEAEQRFTRLGQGRRIQYSLRAAAQHLYRKPSTFCRVANLLVLWSQAALIDDEGSSTGKLVCRLSFWNQEDV